MNAPATQSRIDTPVTPHATFSADQGTIPTSRRTASRTQADDAPLDVDAGVLLVEGLGDLGSTKEDFELDEEPSNAARVSSMGLGKNRVRKGASGAAKSVEKSDPSVVSAVMTNVARTG